MLQKEHTESIERITKSKESERQAIEIMKVDGTNVQNILNKTHVIVEGLEKLRKKFENRDNTFVQSQDQHLLIQEKNIECKCRCHNKAILCRLLDQQTIFIHYLCTYD